MIQKLSVNDSEVSFSPSRGGIITSLKILGTEILYFDEETFADPEANVRGGIPILFPNAGLVESSLFPGLKQHGFARNSSNWKSEIHHDRFIETLTPEEKNVTSYPCQFELTVSGIISANGSFVLEQKVTNLEKTRELPIAMGLHPYIKVPNAEKENIVFNFEGGSYISDHATQWMNGETIVIDNPKTKDPSAVLEIVIPSLGTLIMDVSVEYQKIWIWSQPGKDFICIEPTMRDIGGFVTDPEKIPPGGIYTASIRFDIRRS